MDYLLKDNLMAWTKCKELLSNIKVKHFNLKNSNIIHLGITHPDLKNSTIPWLKKCLFIMLIITSTYKTINIIYKEHINEKYMPLIALPVYLYIISKTMTNPRFPMFSVNKNITKKNNWHAIKANNFDIRIIVNYFEKHKPYLDKDLNLDLVASQIGIHKQQLSYIINNKLDTHFSEMLSTYRVKEAQQKLLDPIYRIYTIDAIAQEAGFNSRANFYEAFKKHTGLTPTEYRKKYGRRQIEENKKERVVGS